MKKEKLHYSCRKCNILLIRGDNWSQGKYKHKDRICRLCHYIAYKNWSKLNPENFYITNCLSRSKHTARVNNLEHTITYEYLVEYIKRHR